MQKEFELELNHLDILTKYLKEIINEDFINDIKHRYPRIDIESLNDYLPNDKVKILKPDIVCGMNSTKGKSNTIVLAGACLAVKLGYYKPKAKAGFEGLLNSLDEAEINEAYETLSNEELRKEYLEKKRIIA